MKRLISFILCMLMLLSLVPAAIYAEDAENAPAYDLPEAGDKVNIVGTGKAEEAKIGGSGSAYYNIHRYGEGYAHTVKFRKFSENNDKNYDPAIILYCIQFVKLDKSKYEVFKPVEHEYWQGLTEIAREGILLSIGLGYPASTLEELSSDSVTVTADDALAATQTLAWEFELGLRTTFEPFTADEIAAKKDTLFTGNYAGNPNVNGINGTPAETAYNKILERIRAFKEEHPHVTLKELEGDPNFVLLAAEDAQTLLSYRLPEFEIGGDDDTGYYYERGAIEIHKTDTDGYPLAGAKFEIRDENDMPVLNVGVDGVITTDESGYAFTKKDVLDFGTYYVREIEAPEGYERVTAPWTVTIGADTPMIDGVRKVVIEAVNESVKISLTVNKVWNDANDQDGKRPDSITVKLLADGIEIDTAQLAADGWVHTFDALPKYRDGGIEIAYSVLEVVPEGYTADYDKGEGLVTITNTYTPETTSLTVNKVWNDADDQDGKRPDSITVKLLADGVEIKSAELTADGWAHVFDALPKYRDGGIEIAYSVLEVVPDGYTASYDKGEGIVTITNTYTPATTSLTVNKVWNDANDQDGKRPDSITVKLLADGVEIKSAELTADGWAHVFDALPKYRDGGIEIAYSVLEVVPDGYTASYDMGEGVVTITNTYTPATTSLTVNKVWNDADDQDGKRPDSITVKLLADGIEIDSAQLAADGWTHTFDALPKYRDGGVEISYSVLEVVPEGYTAAYDVAEGVVTITNTYTPATTSLTVNKVWNDANDQDGKRPDSITVKLLADGIEIDTAQLAADGWTHTFDALPKYRDGGIEIAYSVLEVVPDGYTAAYDVAEGIVTITNTYTPATTSLTVNKVWNDANDQDGKRPDSITVKLLADGVEIDSAQLAADGWTHTFDALPKYRDGGVEISYSVLEVIPEGYTADYDVAEGVVTITNTYTPATTSLTVNKVWNDANDQDGKRPDSITVKLLADGVEIDTAQLAADGWTHTFNGLPKYRDGGIEISYSVIETVPDGYTASYDKGEGVVTITNTHTPATTSLTVNKVWNDANDQDGKRPDSITVKLLADGVEIESAELTADGWAHTFDALPKYRDGGVEILYSVVETVPDGYTADYDKGEGVVTITNTYTPATTSLTVNKVWNDANDQDGKRPDSITVKLLADGIEIDTAQLAADGWSFTFNGLPKYRDGGVEISYSVLEVIPEGYTADYDVAEGVVTITNTYTPETTSLTVNKVWNDADDQDGKRPDSVTVKLLADGIEIDSAQLAADGWTHVFDALPKYRDGGIEIAYSVLEVVPDGYTAEYDKGEGVVTITNTYTPETTSLTVKKVWNDANDQDGKRPDSVTVKLLADGVEIKSAELTADGWAHVFDALPKYRDGGIEIAYSVLEVVPDGYTADYDVAEGVVTITNTYTPATTFLTVNKVWNDADDQDGKRPDSITVKLLADGIEIDSAQLAADGWSFTFNGLPKYRDGGIAILYSVVETVPDGYTAAYDVAEGVVTITNTYTPATTSLTVNKVWNDADDQDGKRPDSITVKLLADGIEIDSAQLAADGWTHVFDVLPKYRDGGIEIAYSVLEVVPDGYTASYDKGEGVVTITNTYTPELTSVNVTKTWYDENDNDNIRPASVTIRLYADGVQIAVCELSAASDWAHLFGELPRYRDGGEEIVYTITEDPVTDYETVYDGYDVFNSHDPYRCDITVNKVWNDEDNVHGLRPDSVTVRLFADGVEIDSAVLSAENGWSVTFDGLLEFAYGSAIVYEIREDDVTYYSSRIEGSAEDGFTVVNTVEYVPPTGDGSSLAALGILAVLSLAAPFALKRRRRSDA